MTRTEFPDDVVAAMRAAASGAPSYHGDLAAVRQRGRVRRRRRAAAATGFAAVAVAAAVAVPSIVNGQAAGPVERPQLADPPPASAPAAPAAPAEPAQRLLLDGAGWVVAPSGEGTEITEYVGPQSGETAREAYERLGDVPGAVGVLGGLAELRPDGEVLDIELDPPGIDSVREVVAMPDGRLAVIGIVDRMPGVSREDGPCVEGVDFPLLVVEADGSVSLSREIRVMCETLTLLDADADTAYLVRDSRLVAHDLATGEERVLVDSPDMLPVIGQGSVAAGRIATVATKPADTGCQAGTSAMRLVVRVAEFPSGATSEHPLPSAGCVEFAGPVRLSPDGRYAAIAYHRSTDDGDMQSELRVAVVDLDTGDAVADRVIVGADQRNEGVDLNPRSITSSYGAIAGIAWDDEQTLRVAWYEVPAEGVHWMADLVEVSTFSVS
jgi:hypothetical protein